jgi:Flp pilus assembly protein CpaB
MGAGRRRRTGVILILVILILLIAGIGILFYLSSQGGLGGVGTQTGGTGGGLGGGDADEAPTATPPPVVNVIVAARDIPRGARVSVEDVTVMGWPVLAEAPPPPGALTVSAAEGGPGLEQVEGRIARVDILNGQPVLDFFLTPGDEPTSLADEGSNAALLIPSGQVAIAMPINRLSSVAYAIREGDHVDVLMSIRFVDVDEDLQTILPNQGLLLTDDPELLALGLSGFQYTVGREESGPFGLTQIILPSALENRQRPRQASQLVVDNVTVLRVGNWPLAGLNAPIVVTAAPPPTPVPQEQGEATQAPPTITPIPLPDVVTLAMNRQDAVVLKYAIETGVDIDLVLRSALDDDVNDIVTDTVTLQYIIDFYNVVVPPRLPIAQDPRIDTNLGGGVTFPGEAPGTTPVPPSP